MATFGGINIFGTAVTMTTVENPRSTQVNAYFGLDGVEVLDGGLRGRTTLASGLLSGETPEAIAVAEAAFRLMADGQVRTLVDSYGTTWLNVRMESFQPRGPLRHSPSGRLFRAYQARFLHLA